MNPDKLGNENAVLNIVKEKFRQGENVVSVCLLLTFIANYFFFYCKMCRK